MIDLNKLLFPNAETVLGAFRIRDGYVVYKETTELMAMLNKDVLADTTNHE